MRAFSEKKQKQIIKKLLVSKKEPCYNENMKKINSLTALILLISLAGSAAAYSLVLQTRLKQQYPNPFLILEPSDSESLSHQTSTPDTPKQLSQELPEKIPDLDSPKHDSESLQEKEPETDSPEKDSPSPWEWAKDQAGFHRLNPSGQEQVLSELNGLFFQKSERLKALSFLRLGTPYQFGCLGEGENQKDSDPVFRLDVTDCTAFVLTNVALLNAYNLEQAKENMKIVNYRPQIGSQTGQKEYQLSFENRLHFTTDRNSTSPLFEDITSTVAFSEELRNKEVVLNRVKEDGTRIIDIEWQKQVELTYIPNNNISQETLNRLPETAGIAFIKEDYFQLGLDVAHEGFLFNQSLLVHASSEQNKVVAVDFLDYYFGRQNEPPRFDGIIVFNPLITD